MTMCDDKQLETLIKTLQAEGSAETSMLDETIKQFPEDARLHFLQGSMLIGKGKLIEGHRALVRAVELAPDYDIARFQLGFFQLTSGEVDNALTTWERLDQLPDGHYLKTFVVGLRHLVRDEYAACITNLQAGIAANTENVPLNADMTLIINEITPLMQSPDTKPNTDNVVSSTSLMLNQFSDQTKH